MKKMLAILMAAAMLLALCACGSAAPAATESAPADSAAEAPAAEAPAEEAAGEAAADSDLAYIQGKGTLVVGITDFAPMDYQENGEWVGFDADMAKAFAESIGVKAEFVEINWDNKELELDGKSIDCVWNGMTLTDAVKAAMSCPAAYCNNAQVVVVKAESAEQYQDMENIQSLSFAVEAGSAGQEAADAASLNYIECDTQAKALMEVAAGTSDACIIDLLMAGAMIGEGTSYPDLAYTVSLTSEEYGVGFRKGSDLVDAYTAFYKAAWDAGTVMQIAETYGVQESIIGA